MKRTQAIDILTKAKVDFEVREFPAAEFTAEEVAVKLDIPLPQVFKTLVVQSDDHRNAIAIVPGDKELSLKKLAAAWGVKRADLAPLKDLQRLTGYLKGGCSPLGTRHPMPVYLDSSARHYDRISVSAGLRGVQVLIHADTLVAVAEGQFAELV